MTDSPESMRRSRPVPLEIRHRTAARVLEIDFDTNETFRIPAEQLRVMSPSAEVKGHGGQKPPPVTGKENVQILQIKPVGNYAVRLIFDDGHDSGLYSWDLLYDLGKNRDHLWQVYLDEVARHAGPGAIPG